MGVSHGKNCLQWLPAPQKPFGASGFLWFCRKVGSSGTHVCQDSWTDHFCSTSALFGTWRGIGAWEVRFQPRKSSGAARWESSYCSNWSRTEGHRSLSSSIFQTNPGRFCAVCTKLSGGSCQGLPGLSPFSVRHASLRALKPLFSRRLRRTQILVWAKIQKSLIFALMVAVYP